jgi:hypothetical protein
MKTLFGIGLIVVGIYSLSTYPNLGRNAAETFGALLGIFLLAFLPAFLLIKSDSKSNKDEK